MRERLGRSGKGATGGLTDEIFRLCNHGLSRSYCLSYDRERRHHDVSLDIDAPHMAQLQTYAYAPNSMVHIL